MRLAGSGAAGLHGVRAPGLRVLRVADVEGPVSRNSWASLGKPVADNLAS